MTALCAAYSPSPIIPVGEGIPQHPPPAFPGHMNTGVAKDGDGTVAPSTQVGDIRHVESPIGPYVWGAFFVKPSEAPLSRQTPSFAVACLLRKTISTPPGPGEWFYTWGNHPSLLAGSGRSLSSPLPQLRRSIQNTFESHPFLKAKTLYAITQKNIKIFFIFFGANAIVKR